MNLINQKSTTTGVTPLNNGKPFGIDVSRYQGTINWNTVAANSLKVVFAAIRATISWGYTDPMFARNWSEAKRVGILRMAYHVVYPGESIVRQVDNFTNALNGDFGELPPVLDLELDHGYSKAAITKNVQAIAELIEDRVGRKPVFYSRASWINTYTETGSWRNAYDWWLATYLSSLNEHPGPPLIPTGVDTARVYFHQSSNKGTPIGVESAALDYDRCLKSLTELYAYANTEPEEEEEDPVVVPPSSATPWSGYAIGCEVHDAAEIPALVADGVSFVIGLAGGLQPGTQNYQWENPKWAGIVQAAYDIGIPVLGRWNPVPAIPGRTQQAVVDEQLPTLIKSLKAGSTGVKYVSGFIINSLLYTDLVGKTATDSNIMYTVTQLAAGVENFYREKNRTTPVFLRNNHFYIRDNAPSLDPIMKNYKLLLAHPAYRMKAENNAHYPIPSAKTTTVASLRAHLNTLPAGWNNPLVPTGSDFWFWGIGEFPHKAVSYSPYWVLFKGSKTELYSKLNYTRVVKNFQGKTLSKDASADVDYAQIIQKLEAAARAFLDTD